MHRSGEEVSVTGQVLDRAFYQRAPFQVARALLGCHLIREHEGTFLVSRITETEAYGGIQDTASHASRGRTPRNLPMFGPPGHAYIYLVYGLHEMLNIVTGPEGEPGAVLIRGIQPLSGEESIKRWGSGKGIPRLCNGPGKLTRALAITRAALNNHDLCQGHKLWIAAAGLVCRGTVTVGPRVGVDYASANDRDAPLRFQLRGHAPGSS